MFTAQIGLQKGLALKYFSGIDTTTNLSVDVNPAFLSKYTGAKKGRKGKNTDELN